MSKPWLWQTCVRYELWFTLFTCINILAELIAAWGQAWCFRVGKSSTIIHLKTKKNKNSLRDIIYYHLKVWGAVTLNVVVLKTWQCVATVLDYCVLRQQQKRRRLTVCFIPCCRLQNISLFYCHFLFVWHFATTQPFRMFPITMSENYVIFMWVRKLYAQKNRIWADIWTRLKFSLEGYCPSDKNITLISIHHSDSG